MTFSFKYFHLNKELKFWAIIYLRCYTNVCFYKYKDTINMGNSTFQIIKVIFGNMHIIFQIFTCGINITTSNHDFLHHNMS